MKFNVSLSTIALAVLLLGYLGYLIQTRNARDSIAFKKKHYELKYKNYNKHTFPLYNNHNYRDENLKSTILSNCIESWAKIVDVIDGDTFLAILELPQQSICMCKIRLIGNNTPELSSNEIINGYESKKIVEDMILHKIVYLKIHGNDVYARMLADVYIDEIHLNEYLIQNKYAEKNGLSKI
jgi:endonuclease YncB( thermonuclease family)